MTTSTNPTVDFQRDQILTAAIRQCGLLSAGEEPRAEQLADAAVHLSFALLELQSEGIVLTGRVREVQAFTASTATYTLAANTLDVHVDSDDIVGMTFDDDGVEMPVRAMTGDDYQRTSDKASEAERPSLCFVDRGTQPITLTFWPVPSTADISFRYTRVRLQYDFDQGDQTPELRRVWAPYLTYRVAAGVAADNSKWALVDRFRGWAESLKKTIAPVENECVAVQLHVGRRGR